MDMIGRIRRLHSRRNKSEREIARITGLSRNTVAKWLHGEVDGAPKYRRGEQPNKLTVFHEALKRALKADARRPKHERRTAKALYAEIKAAGYAGGYTRVTDFIRAWRQAEGQAATTNAFIPLAFELGEAFQFDWSEEGLVVGGIYYRAQVSHMKLCASRAFWLVAYPSGGHEMLFDAHTRSFAALGRLAGSERVRLARGYLEVAGAVDGEGRRGGRWRACVRGSSPASANDFQATALQANAGTPMPDVAEALATVGGRPTLSLGRARRGRRSTYSCLSRCTS